MTNILKGAIYYGDEDQTIIDPYANLWMDMIQVAIEHAHWQNMADVERAEKLIECHESRCYLISDMFEEDAVWLDEILTAEAIAEVRKCKWSAHLPGRCIVCGRAGNNKYREWELCWEHNLIVKAYNNVRDAERIYKKAESIREKKKLGRPPAQLFLIGAKAENIG